MSSLPYLLQAIVGWVASLISDKIRQRDIVSVTMIRKVNNTIGIEFTCEKIYFVEKNLPKP